MNGKRSQVCYLDPLNPVPRVPWRIWSHPLREIDDHTIAYFDVYYDGLNSFPQLKIPPPVVPNCHRHNWSELNGLYVFPWHKFEFGVPLDLNKARTARVVLKKTSKDDWMWSEVNTLHVPMHVPIRFDWGWSLRYCGLMLSVFYRDKDVSVSWRFIFAVRVEFDQLSDSSVSEIQYTALYFIYVENCCIKWSVAKRVF